MLYALLMTTLAGLATGIGGMVAVIRRPGRHMMAVSMGFAAGVMIAVSLMDLLPESMEYYEQSFTPLATGFAVSSLLIMGMVIAALLEGCLPENSGLVLGKSGDRAQVLRSALVTGLALLLHNLPEGILTLFSGVEEPELGFRLTLAVALHNLPEGLAVAAPLYYATNSRVKAMGAAVISGLAEPVGAVLAFCLVGRFLTEAFLNGLLLLVAGIMCWISVFELLPTGFSFGKRLDTALGFSAGLLVMLLGISVLS